MYSCIFVCLPQLHPEGVGDVLDSSTPLLLGYVIPCYASRCRQRKGYNSSGEFLPVILLTTQFDYRDVSGRGGREELRLP